MFTGNNFIGRRAGNWLMIVPDMTRFSLLFILGSTLNKLTPYEGSKKAARKEVVGADAGNGSIETQ